MACLKGRMRGKGGAALAYVIIAAAVLMVLSGALVSAAGRNTDLSARSGDGRQAYLTAKSAIEYAKAVVYSEAQKGSSPLFGAGDSAFYVLDQKADPAALSWSQTGAGAEQNQVAVCTIAKTDAGYDIDVNADVKYRGSDRREKLSYSFTCAAAPGPAVPAAPGNFMVVGVKYGLKQILDNGWYPMFRDESDWSGVTSDYPFLTKFSVQGNDSQNYRLAAPSAYFMGKVENTSGDWLRGISVLQYYGTVNVKSDFIYFAGDISGRDDRFSNPSGRFARLILNPLKTDSVVLCFAGTDGAGNKISVSLGAPTDGNANRKSVVVPKGYYRLNQNGTDLYDLARNGYQGYLTKLTDSQAADYSAANRIDFISGSVSGMVTGNSWEQQYQGTQWAPDGDLSCGVPTSWIDGSGTLQKSWVVSSDKLATMDDKLVYVYVTSVDGWQNAFNNGPKAVYRARLISLQYVNPSRDFVIPAGKTVVFQTDSLSFNTQTSDASAETGAENKPRIVSSASGTAFQLQSLGGQPVEASFPTAVQVVYNDGTGPSSYTIRAGKYAAVPNNLNLLSGQAKTYFETTSPAPLDSGGSGGAGGSGGVQLTFNGGVYKR